MTEAFVYDAIRTPRGKGKKDGGLYEVKPINLLAGVVTELQRRNGLDTSKVDDVVMGVVSPVGEQGSVIAKVAAQKARSGWEDLVVAGGVESMSRVPIGSDGGAWAVDPQTNSQTAFVPQGIGADLIATLEGFSSQDVDGFAMTDKVKITVVGYQPVY